MARRSTLTLTQSQRHELVDGRDHDPKLYVPERSAARLLIADNTAATDEVAFDFDQKNNSNRPEVYPQILERWVGKKPGC
ncbi:MAG: hypothetical protein ACFCD0_18115 [Gemmataceae bacterium]